MSSLNNIFTIAYYTILRYIRDRKTLTSMILLPVMLIIILGTGLNNYFSVYNINPIKVGYINKDKGEISKSFKEFLNHDSIKDILVLENYENYEKAVEGVKSKDIDALILIEEDYSEKVLRGEAATIKVFGNKYGTFNRKVVQNIVDSYISGANTTEALMKVGGAEALKNIDYEGTKILKDESISITGVKPRAIDYYAVTMMVMTIMYGTMYGSYGIAEDNLYSTGMRIKSAPTKYFEVFIGKALGIVFTLFWQFTFLILVSKYIYGANFGSDIGKILFICLTLSMVSTSLGMAVCTLIKNEKVAGSLLNMVVPIFTFISGGYAKFDLPPNSFFDKLRLISPNHLAQTSIFNTIYGGSLTQTNNFILTLWIITFVFIAIASLFGRRLAHK